MKFLIPFLFLSLNANAYVHMNSNSGLGKELLLNGAGQARLGSNGAQNSNPSLLAWLPKQHEYLSSNTIKISKFRTEGGRVDSPVTVVPLSALSTEGFGNWGHSYGVVNNSDIYKVNLAIEGGDTNFDLNKDYIGFGYGFGKRIENFAYGLAINIERVSSISKSVTTTNENGFTDLSTAERKFSFWNLSLNPGLTSRHGDWSFGISSKFTILKTNASFKNKLILYSEEFDFYERTSDQKSDPIQNIPEFRTGLQKRFENSLLHFDLVYQPAYSDREYGESASDQLKGILAFDQAFWERFRYYTSVSYAPAVEFNYPIGEASIGISKKNKHSTNFIGSSIKKELDGPQSSLIQIIFGSTFLY